MNDPSSYSAAKVAFSSSVLRRPPGDTIGESSTAPPDFRLAAILHKEPSSAFNWATFASHSFCRCSWMRSRSWARSCRNCCPSAGLLVSWNFRLSRFLWWIFRRMYSGSCMGFNGLHCVNGTAYCSAASIAMVIESASASTASSLSSFGSCRGSSSVSSSRYSSQSALFQLRTSLGRAIMGWQPR